MNVSSIQDLKTLKNRAPKKSEDQKFGVNVSSFQGFEVLKITARKNTATKEVFKKERQSEEPSAKESRRQKVLLNVYSFQGLEVLKKSSEGRLRLIKLRRTMKTESSD